MRNPLLFLFVLLSFRGPAQSDSTVLMLPQVTLQTSLLALQFERRALFCKIVKL